MGWVNAHFSEQRLVCERSEGRLACSNCHYFWKLRLSSPVSFVSTSSLPHPPEKNSRKHGIKNKKMKQLFQFPTPPIWCQISHPSIKSQPSPAFWYVGVVVRVCVVGVCVWGGANLNPRLFSCKLWAGRNTSLGWVFPSIYNFTRRCQGDWLAGSK